ncbi:Crp/Fnr family transcriptional regulator [Alkalibacter saccharofermentans]|uniref:CRP/FNR family transcriptional regulator, anaerobic regulatory protein n=1 Tax=Alkalibacter saccharofermentans DSM 14828 TaxID=1120975 RepID=A0A1M4SME9_9FIRM|nr:Crp/Fnr family transcriptional regulator [Alkalibacter saccharofermentans]SHE33332.1 CRP/FNR family transcriptional regulator, anaerobic regulatory protein [Alkalibacter saccharofermentans DSM 14828]
MSKKEFERTFEMLSHLKDSQLSEIFRHAVIKVVEKGQFLQMEGEGCYGVPFILEGSIRFYRTTEDGKEKTLFRLGKGEVCLLAAMCILSEMDYSFNAYAEKNSRIMVMPTDLFFDLYHRDEIIQKYIFRQLTTKLITAYEQVEASALYDVRTRLEEYLSNHKDTHNIVVATHEKIAGDIGTSREVVTRNLKKLQMEDKIELRRGRIFLK